MGMSARAGVETSPQLASPRLLQAERVLDARGKSPVRRIKVGLVALAALAVLLPTEKSRAQDAYPTRLVRIIVPYPAGGGTDTLARLLADQLSRKWGQPAIVENIGGAAGNIGSAEVARATPRWLHVAPGLTRSDREQRLSLQTGGEQPSNARETHNLVFWGDSRLTTLCNKAVNATRCHLDVSPTFPQEATP